MAGIVGSIFTSKNIPTLVCDYYNNSRTFNNRLTGFLLRYGTTLYINRNGNFLNIFLLSWRQRVCNEHSKPAIYFFAIQLILNTLWSVIFFGNEARYWSGFIEICVLWIFILLSIISFYGISPVASLLLIPYSYLSGFHKTLRVSEFFYHIRLNS